MRVAIPDSVSTPLVAWLNSHPEGHERGAVLFLRKFEDRSSDLETSDRYVLIDWRKLDGSEVIDSSPTSLKYSLRNLPPDFYRCENESLIFGFAHCHPLGGLEFSETDDKNEQVLLRALKNYSAGDSAELIALLWAKGRWLARRQSTRPSDSQQSYRHTLVHSHRVRAHPKKSDALGGWNNRQAAAFGKPFNDLLALLRVGIIGLGGTGSPLAHIAARSGVGQLVIVDGDDVSRSNLNRTAGYTASDIGKKKSQVTKLTIGNIGLGTEIEEFPKFLDECGEAIDVLSTCDIIFGCTDDVIGRDILNQIAYYYCIPYIDVGLSGRIEDSQSENPFLAEHRARISCVMPTSGSCLRCQRVVTDEKLAYQQELKRRPELGDMDANMLKEEFYLVGGGEPAPGVGPFTSAAAQFAFMAMMDLLKPFRKFREELVRDNIWVDFINLYIYSNDHSGDDSCFVCGLSGLLNRSEGNFRLGTPKLGRK